MTNYQPLKNKIWFAAQAKDDVEFNKHCTELIDKAQCDWWRIGWSFCPQNIDDAIKLIEGVGKAADEAWRKAIKDGEAPDEDISPAESFFRLANMIRELKNEV